MQSASAVMDDCDGGVAALDPVQVRAPRQPPRYEVILWDDDAHTCKYVMRMLQEVCGHDPAEAFRLAEAVDEHGRAAVFSGSLQEASLCRDKITAYGKDKTIAGCKGSMTATLAPG